ncbi:adenine phosphoribosyltransferase [Christensenella tenuis]|uniref:Adenine phosphoribosyltransferase n=1 Tax=Christensenella tenuis TaxID=2763033 RepID=A0ABR7EBF2_9FIRM|nr:adenine phosphoribosyltransferase [Christensenella tenuis]MBC5647102.1 adenine phosphoribosyltransferase [Christensenella tenuis]
MDLKAKIRNIEDFPEKGVIFRDITTLIKDPDAFGYVTDTLASRVREQDVDMIVVLDARGFLFGSPVAYLLKKGIVPVRKKGKLPADVYHVEYQLEYGTDQLEMHKDAIKKGMRVAVFDDLLATGGTAKAACELVELAGAEVVSLNFVIELTDLGGRAALGGYDVFSLVQY